MPESWWLKFKRATHHMVDIRREAKRYADSHPYEIVRIREPKRQAKGIRYRLRITEQPDPLIAVILGDFVHNLRSALDHVVVASSRTQATRKSAYFPIQVTDPWERDASRRYIVRDKEVRKGFRRAIAGLHPDAQTLVVRLQPYSWAGRVPSDSILHALNRLENADKHREVIAIGSGLRYPVYTLTHGGQADERRPIGPNQFLYDGAEVRFSHSDGATLQSELKVELRGTTTITIKIAGGGRKQAPAEHNLFKTMLISLYTVRFILRKLEPFAR